MRKTDESYFIFFHHFDIFTNQRDNLPLFNTSCTEAINYMKITLWSDCKGRDILELHRGEPRGKKIINDMPPLKNYRNEHNWYWMMFKVFNSKRRRIGINPFDINHMKRSEQIAKLRFLTIPFKMFVICTSSSFPHPCKSVLILLMYSFMI